MKSYERRYVRALSTRAEARERLACQIGRLLAREWLRSKQGGFVARQSSVSLFQRSEARPKSRARNDGSQESAGERRTQRDFP
jgi:hypothetical protein